MTTDRISGISMFGDQGINAHDNWDAYKIEENWQNICIFNILIAMVTKIKVTMSFWTRRVSTNSVLITC